MAGESLPATHVQNVGLTYYVDAVTGNDSTGNGSAGQPWATLTKSYTYLRDTAVWPSNQDIKVVVRSGNYQALSGQDSTLKVEFNQATRKPTATQWVIWEWDRVGTRPKVKLPAGTSPVNHKYGIRLTTVGTSFVASFLQFIGLDIDGEQTRTNVTIDSQGFYLNNAHHVEIIDCKIHGIYSMDTATPGPATSKAQGIFADAGASANLIVTRCQIYDIGTTTGSIDIQEHGIYCSGPASVIGNVVYDIRNGFGVQFYNSGAAIADILVAGNTIGGTIEKSCLVVPGHATNARIKNNIFKGATEYGIELYPATFSGSNNVLDRNIHHGNTAGTKSHASAAGWTMTNESTSDPLFVNYGARNFHLLAGSPAIGFADDPYINVIDFDGNTRDSSPDVGAYEYGLHASVSATSIGAFGNSGQPAIRRGATATPASIPAAAAPTTPTGVGGSSTVVATSIGALARMSVPAFLTPSIRAVAGLGAPVIQTSSNIGTSLPTLHVANVGLTLYVDAVNGNDANNGTSLAQAWRTLQRAEDQLGSTVVWPSNQDIRVYVREGNYQGSNVQSTLAIDFGTAGRKPTATQWVIWERYPGDDRPRILLPSGTSPSNHKYGITLTTSGSFEGGFQQLIGFDIDGQSVRQNGSGDAVGIYYNGADNVQVIDCEIHHLQAGDTGGATSKAQGMFAGTNSTDIYVTRCFIHDIGTTTGTINAQEHGSYLGGARSKVWNNVYSNLPNGFGAQFYASNASIADILLANNTFAGTFEKSCVILPGHATNCVIKNNIMKGSSEYGIEFYPPNFTGSNNVMSHNVIQGNSAGTKSHAAPANWSVSNELTSDPLFVNFAARNLALTSSSPARGHCDDAYAPSVDRNNVSRGNDPDAGALEFVSGDTTVTPGSIGAIGGFGATTLHTGAQFLASTIGAVVAVPAPTARGGAVSVPAGIAATVGLGASISLTPSVDVSAPSIGAIASVGVPTMVATTVVGASSIAAPVTVPGPTVVTTSFAEPTRRRWVTVSVTSRNSTIKRPTGPLTNPDQRAWVIPLLPLSTSTTVAVATIAAVARPGVAALSAGCTALAGALGATAGVPAIAFSRGTTAPVSSIAAVAGADAPVISDTMVVVLVSPIAAVAGVDIAVVAQVLVIEIEPISAVASLGAYRTRAMRGRLGKINVGGPPSQRLRTILAQRATQRARGPD